MSNEEGNQVETLLALTGMHAQASHTLMTSVFGHI
jgi:hypothetical protein